MTMRTDANDMVIGDGTYHANYHIENFEGRNISVKVNKSLGTESVYVYYTNNDNDKVAKVRFSNHICNGVKFGDYVDGNTHEARLQILYKLGLAEYFDAPVAPYIKITQQYIGKKKVAGREIIDVNEADILAMDHDADFSQFVGKIYREGNAFVEIKNIKVVSDATVKKLREII